MHLRLAAAFLFTTIVASGASAQSNELVFAVTEGVTYQATPKEIRDKFAPIAQVLATATGKRVRTVLVPAYNDARAGLAAGEYDVVFMHPAHLALAEVKAGRYKAVAWTTGFTEYTASMLMTPNQPFKSMQDLKGLTIVTPDPDSITAWMVRAMFRAEKIPLIEGRDTKPDAVRVITTRYQDSVPFYLENQFAQVAVTASNAVVKGWTEKGGKVLTKSRTVPIKQFLVSSSMPAADQQRIRAALLGLAESKGGPQVLEAVGYRGFVAPNPEVEAAVIAWLGL
jgi:ABC-type phosphate/phosphonate transport system substrate-binding protein